MGVEGFIACIIYIFQSLVKQSIFKMIYIQYSDIDTDEDIEIIVICFTYDIISVIIDVIIQGHDNYQRYDAVHLLLLC
jgi:hypothetical protein